MILSLGFKFYMDYFGNYNAAYGSIGGIIVLMQWLYLSGLFLLIGGEINAELGKAIVTEDKEAPKKRDPIEGSGDQPCNSADSQDAYATAPKANS